MKRKAGWEAIKMQQVCDQFRNGTQDPTKVTEVQLAGNVAVAAEAGFLRFWVAGREVRVGPLTANQCEQLSEDLSYETLPEKAKVA